jgi:hypothetical protein
LCNLERINSEIHATVAMAPVLVNAVPDAFGEASLLIGTSSIHLVSQDTMPMRQF